MESFKNNTNNNLEKAEGEATLSETFQLLIIIHDFSMLLTVVLSSSKYVSIHSISIFSSGYTYGQE